MVIVSSRLPTLNIPIRMPLILFFVAWLPTFYFSIIFFYFEHQEDENADNTPSHSRHTEKTVSYKKAYRLMMLLFRYYFFFLSF